MLEEQIDRRTAGRVVRVGSILLMAIGATVMAGWAADIHVLKALTRHGVTMKANTALGLFLSGLSGWLVYRADRRWNRTAGPIIATLLFLLGAATFSQHLMGWNLGIDELLFTEPTGERYTTSPNRMGPPAAISFALAGVAYLGLSLRTQKPVQWIGCVLLVIAMLPMLGYLSGAEEFYGVASLTGIAPHTACSLAVLGIVILFQRHDKLPVSLLFDRAAGGEMVRRMLPAALIVPPVLGWLAAIAQDQGLAGGAFTRATILVVVMVLFTSLIWTTGLRLSHADRERHRAEADVLQVRATADRLAVENVETLNLLEAMLENAPVGLAFLDRELKFVRVNPYLARLNGVPIEAHIGRTVREVLPETDWNIEPVLNRIFETGQTANGIELVGATPAEPGVPRAWLDSFYPIRDGQGVVKLVGALVVEITDRKRLEEQRVQLLESERAARAEAERAGILKDEFLATLSHELRTPLSAITGWASILKRKQIEDPDIREAVEIIDRNARVQIQLVNDLLDVSRIISGKLRLDVQSVDLPATIEAAVAVVTPSAAAKGVRIEKLIDSAALTMNGDPARIQQIVWNLLSNAIKFTPKEGKVQVRLQRVNSHVEITVSDTGIGIKPAFLPYMFERFRQADATTTRQYGGLGLGLSIVRQLTEMHGGFVRVSSPGENQGTTFVVHLPLAVVHEPQSGGRVHPTAIPIRDHVDCERTPLHGVRVLVVDDQPDARALLARLLSDCEASVEQCSSTDHAIAMLDYFKPTVLISDIGMPDKDGYELIREVRQRFDSRALPAIALTAFARPDDRRRTMLAGFQIHISKPVDAQEVIAAVATLSGRTGVPRRESPSKTD